MSYEEPGNRVEIEYCVKCKWMLRAAWLAQELLTTFEGDLLEVALIPGRGRDGIFDIRVGDNVVWSREIERGFPQPKQLKQRIRDLITPGRSLGHLDR